MSLDYITLSHPLVVDVLQSKAFHPHPFLGATSESKTVTSHPNVVHCLEVASWNVRGFNSLDKRTQISTSLHTNTD